MKIAVLPWFMEGFDFSHPGGVLVMCIRQAEHLSQMGHHVRIFGQDAVGEHPLMQALRSYRFAGSRRRILALAEFTVRTLGYDILQGANLTFMARRFPRRSLVYYHNALPLENYERYKNAYHETHYVFCSSYVQSWFAEKYPDISPARFHVIHNAVDTNDFHPADIRPSQQDGIKQILFMAAWTREKGIDLLPEIIAELDRLRPTADYRWLIAGSTDFWKLPGDEAIRINALVKALGEKYPNVEIVGKLSREQAARSMAEADVFISPVTWQEPFGLTLVEAMASQTPVIASALGGIPEIIQNGKNGVLLPSPDPKAFAQALNNLLDQPGERLELGRAARQSVETRFSWDTNTTALLEVYKQIQLPDLHF